jgi:hypothetical protein
MSDERKVIQFKKPFKKQLVKTTPNDLRAAATGTIAFILLLMVGLNFQIFEGSKEAQAHRQQSMNRGLASVPRVLEPRWKKSLSELGEKEMVVKGMRPTAIDSLTYGYLKGNYSFTVEKGVIKNMQFSNVNESQPQVVSNTQKFLNDYSSAIVPKFDSILSSKREVTQNGFKEVYNIQSEGTTKTVEFQLDKNNGLLGITVQ